jgi:hypothetical protein
MIHSGSDVNEGFLLSRRETKTHGIQIGAGDSNDSFWTSAPAEDGFETEGL